MHLQDRINQLDTQQRHQLEELRSDPTYMLDRFGDQRHTSHHYGDVPTGSVDSDHSSRWYVIRQPAYVSFRAGDSLVVHCPLVISLDYVKIVSLKKYTRLLSFWQPEAGLK